MHRFRLGTSTTLHRSAFLRSALYKAAAGKGDQGLRHAELSRSVFEALSLRFEDYAADPEVRGPARHSTDDALRRSSSLLPLS